MTDRSLIELKNLTADNSWILLKLYNGNGNKTVIKCIKMYNKIFKKADG